jgi:hypothetical protein
MLRLVKSWAKHPSKNSAFPACYIIFERENDGWDSTSISFTSAALKYGNTLHPISQGDPLLGTVMFIYINNLQGHGLGNNASVKDFVNFQMSRRIIFTRTSRATRVLFGG